MIAHSFPPMSGPGIFRSFYFAKYLLDFGYKPIVLTISLDDIKGTKLHTDNSLLEKLPEEVVVLRKNTWEPRTFKRFFMRLRVFRIIWFLFFPLFWENSALWPFSAFFCAKKAIKTYDIQTIYTSSGPFSAVLLGFFLKRFTDVKWVLDIRDPYTDGYMWHWPSKGHWYLSRWIERYLFQFADQVIVNTPEVRKLFLRRGLVPDTKLTVLTNGF